MSDPDVPGLKERSGRPARTRTDLRHDPARRGAGPRDRAHPRREGRDRRAARPAERRHPRGRVPDLVAGRVRGGPRDRRLGARTGDRGARANRDRRHRARGRGAEGRRSLADPHVHLDERHPDGRDAQDVATSRCCRRSRTTSSSRRPTPRTSSSPRRTQRGPSWSSCSSASGSPFGTAPRRSTCPTPSGTRRRPSSASWSGSCAHELPDEVVISTHCHNDLGLAVANALAGIENGARQIEVAVNGIGERAGNCSLEEIAMIVRTRGEHLGVQHGLTIKEITRTSRLVSMTTGYSVQPNKAVVGASAFAHESGIHQHGVLANRATYEIMDPLEIGLEGNQLVLGKHSGRHAFVDALDKLGITLDDAQLQPRVHAVQRPRRPQGPAHRPGPRGDRRGGDGRGGGRRLPSRIGGRGRRHAPAATGHGPPHTR